MGVNLFDVIGPVMIGPSSSHTAGAARIGMTALQLLGEKVRTAHILFHGSFAKTGKGHGTDRAVVGGLLGMEVDDSRIRNALTIAQDEGLDITFGTTQLRHAHPNTVHLVLEGVSGKRLTMEAASLGGGIISVRRIGGLAVDFSGQEDTLIVHHVDVPGIIAAVSTLLAGEKINIATMQVYRRQAGADAFMVLELDGKPPAGVLRLIHDLDGVESATFLERRMA